MSDERARWRIAGLAVLALAVAAFVIGSNPANLPEAWIERWVLRKLPLGSSIVDVRGTIDAEGWTSVEEAMSDVGSVVVVEIGRAWLPRKYVYASFSFDRFGRLGDVRIEKRASPILREARSELRGSFGFTTETLRHRGVTEIFLKGKSFSVPLCAFVSLW